MNNEELDRRIEELRAKRRAMTVEEFIEDIESRHFRTNQDTGANSNALMIWNMVREWAGMEKLTHDDLRQRHIETSPTAGTMEDVLKFEEWYKEYKAFTNYRIHKDNYERVVAKGGHDYLFPPQEEK